MPLSGTSAAMDGSHLTSIEHRQPPRVSCLSKGTPSPARQRQEPDRLLGALSGDGARDSQCRGNHRRRCGRLCGHRVTAPPDRHFVSRSGPRQRMKEGLLRRLPMPGVHSVLAIGTKRYLAVARLGPACHRAGMLASSDCSGSGSAAGVSDSGRITCFCTSSAARRCARIVCLALFASRITIHSNISRCAGITLSTRPLSSATSSRIPTSKSWIESSNSVRSGLCAVWARRL